MPSPSQRGRSIPPSPVRELGGLAAAAEAAGVRVHHLNIGQPDLETPRAMRERVRAIADTTFAYTRSSGTPAYVDSLVRYYAGLGIPLSAEHFIATAGGSEALLFALMSCADHGDDALVVEPFYTNYRTFAAMAGVRLVPLASSADDGFHLPPRAAWEAALTPRTKLVLLCNPNNPTGTVYGREELEALAAFCRDHDLVLVSDEVYREFVFDGPRAVSAHELAGMAEHVVVVDSLSKRYSACGIRLGSLSTRNATIATACGMLAQGRLSAPGLAQVAALGALDVDAAELERNVGTYRRRRDVLYEGLCAIPGVTLRRPEGAFYCIAGLPVDDAHAFSRWLLTDFRLDGATVMLAPAAGFYATPGRGVREVRIAYVIDEAALRASLAILRAALAAYPGGPTANAELP